MVYYLSFNLNKGLFAHFVLLIKGRLENQYVIRFYKQRLLSKPCQNQGFILDGFPKSEDQAKELFARKLNF